MFGHVVDLELGECVGGLFVWQGGPHSDCHFDVVAYWIHFFLNDKA